MNALTFFNPRFSSDLFETLDRNFSGYVPAAMNSIADSIGISPRVDVRESDSQYILEMDLPGRTESDVDISLKDRVLSICSKSDEKKEEEDGTWLIKERKTMSFARRFTLPDDVDVDKVAAVFKNGILAVSIPRKAEAQTRNIEIKTA